MTKRASLPGADELFRKTDALRPSGDERAENQSTSQRVGNQTSLQVAAGPKEPRHDEKVTFYCTGLELTRIERARLALRADHRMASDRGRIVRAALAEVLDDFELRGPNSALVKRLEQD